MAGYHVSFAGAGKVGGALCRKLFSAGNRIDIVASETGVRGPLLASECNAKWTGNLKFSEFTDIIIVAVPDHRLESVLSKIECSRKTVVAHTAGSFGLNIYPAHIQRKGLFYPLQTFSQGRNIDFSDLPFFLDYSDSWSGDILSSLVRSVGGRIFEADPKKREIVHLSAVFANNFVNHMLTSSKNIAKFGDIPFDILTPLIKETFSKALEEGPELAQTGPAVRNDYNTIEKQRDLLSFDPELKLLYEEVTASIIKYYKK